MKTRTMLVSLVAFFAGLALCFAADPDMGTWKLNEARSKFSAGATKFVTAIYAPVPGGMVKVTLEGVDKDGRPVHNEWTGKFDGKDYPVTGDSFSDSRSYTKVDAHTMNLTFKKGGKVVGTGTLVDAADGRTRTTTTKSAEAAAFDNVAVYDKK